MEHVMPYIHFRGGGCYGSGASVLRVRLQSTLRYQSDSSNILISRTKQTSGHTASNYPMTGTAHRSYESLTIEILDM